MFLIKLSRSIIKKQQPLGKYFSNRNNHSLTNINHNNKCLIHNTVRISHNTIRINHIQIKEECSIIRISIKQCNFKIKQKEKGLLIFDDVELF